MSTRAELTSEDWDQIVAKVNQKVESFFKEFYPQEPFDLDVSSGQDGEWLIAYQGMVTDVTDWVDATVIEPYLQEKQRKIDLLKWRNSVLLCRTSMSDDEFVGWVTLIAPTMMKEWR